MRTSGNSSKKTCFQALFAICLGTGLSLLGDASIYAVLPTHVDSAGITLASVGILLSINRWVRLPLNGPGGILYEKWPRRRLFVPALFLGALSTLLYASASEFWPLFLGRMLWGIAWVGIWIGGNTIVLDISHQETRGGWIGLYHLSFFLGAGGGALLGGVLTDWLGYHWAMGVCGGLTLLGAVLVWFLLPETKHLRPLDETLTAIEEGEESGEQQTVYYKGELPSAIALLGVDRLVRAGFMVATLGLFLQQEFGDIVNLLGSNVGVATLTGASLGLATFVTAGMTPFIGSFSDRLKNRWLVAALGLLPGIFGFLLVTLGSPLSILSGMVLIAATSGSNYNLSTALIGDIGVPGNHSRRLGVLFTVGDLMSAIGPPLAFAIIPFLGIKGIYYFAAGLFLCIAFLAYFWGNLTRTRYLMKKGIIPD